MGKHILCSTGVLLVLLQAYKTYALLAKDIDKTVGMFYFQAYDSVHGQWGDPSGAASYGQPYQLGYYVSDAPQVIRQHTEWMLQAGVDMVIFDWTNQVPCILNCITTPCDCSFRSDLDMVQNAAAAFVDHQVERKNANQPYIKYTFFIGPCCENHYNGIMLRLAEQIKAMFLRDPGRASVYYLADGKPLLFWWMGNCGNGDMGIPMGTDPFFQHPAFETLIMDNSISGRREAVIDAECYSASTLLWNPAWDWPQMLADGVGMCNYGDTNSPVMSYVIDDAGQPLAMTVQAGIRGCQGWRDGDVCKSVPRLGGDTLRKMMTLAARRDVKMIIYSDWNSWMLGESLSLERSYNLEPDTTLGTLYLDLFSKLVAQWRSGIIPAVVPNKPKPVPSKSPPITTSKVGPTEGAMPAKVTPTKSSIPKTSAQKSPPQSAVRKMVGEQTTGGRQVAGRQVSGR